jgi:hypothetical protein
MNSAALHFSIIPAFAALACLVDQCVYPFISDRLLQMALIFLLVLDLSVRLLPAKPKNSPLLSRSVSPFSLPAFSEDDEDETSMLSTLRTLRHNNESLLQQNAALSITIKNISDKHTLLCEIRNTLQRQRKDSKDLLAHVTAAESENKEKAVQKARNTFRAGSKSEGYLRAHVE